MKHFKLMKGVLACLLSLALVLSCFTTVGIYAADSDKTTETATAPTAVAAAYNWEDNTITSTANATAYVYVLKNEKGNAIKAGTAANGQLASGKISLTDLKIKAVNKNVYFYVCDKEFEAEGKVDANLVIKATGVKKASGKIDYTQADIDDSFAVLSATGTGTDGKALENPVVFWSTEATGTYYPVDDKTASTTRKYADNTTVAKNGFDGRTLREMLEAGGTIYIKIAPNAAAGTYQFPSKVIKVKVVKQAKAPKVAIDVKKDTFSIKNGMDFALFTKESVDGKDTYTLVGSWNTLLPQLKDATTKTLDDSIVATSAYKPVDKKDTDAKKAITDGKVSYTSLKVKTIGYDKLISSLSAPSTDVEYYVGVRTSATAKKPASAVTYFKYSEKTEAPIVSTESCVSGQYLVSTGTDFEKKGLRLKSIANYNGIEGTTGYDDSFEIKATAGSGADTAKAAYEFAVVNTADLDIIDWSTVGWKKLDPAKTKITSKLKTKYNTVSGTTVKKTNAVLSAATIANFTANANVPDGVKTVILVRRAGVKAKTADDTVIASDIIKLYIIKNGKNYEIYSTVSVGEQAAPYTVNFYKYSKSGESTFTWVKDDSLTITGWGGGSGATTEYVSFPTVENADFFQLSGTSISGEKLTAGSGENAGKYAVEVAAGTTAVVKNVAIREYANIKVVGSASGEGAKDTKEIGAVKAGKISSVSGDKLSDGSSVTAYVGTEITNIGILGYTVPTGYVSSGSGAIVATGTGYTGAALADSKVTVTVNTADEVEVTINYPVVKQYTITYDLNKPADVTSTATAPAVTKTNGAKKIATALPTGIEGKKPGATEDADPVDWEVKGWAKSKEATAFDVTADTTFDADTTLYAVWGAK